MAKLQEVCSHIVDCKNRTAPITENGGYFAVGTPAMKGNRINFAEAREISEETYIKWTAKLTPLDGDLLFAREAPVGPVVRINEYPKVAPGQRTVLLRADEERINSDFLYYLLASPRVQERLHTIAMGSTVSHIRVADLKEFDLGEVPELLEQEAHANLLRSLDDKIEANTKLAHTADELASALYLEALRDGQDGFQSLGDLVTLNYGKALPARERLEGTVPVFGSGGKSGTHNINLIEGPSIVVGRKGTVGSLYWVHEPCFPIDTTFWVAPKNADHSLHYLYEVLRRLPLAEMNNDSAVPGLNRTEVLALQAPKLPVSVVLELSDKLVSCRELIEAQQRENERLSVLRDYLLPRLMSGKITVKDAEQLLP